MIIPSDLPTLLKPLIYQFKPNYLFNLGNLGSNAYLL
jgi:hypothetical protein